MKISEIFYTIDQNMQNLGSFVFSNIEPKELCLQFDRVVDKYIDSYQKPAQVGTLEGIDEIQSDVDNLRFLKVVDASISLTNGVGVLPANYRNLLNSRSQVTICGATQKVYNRLHDSEDIYRVIKNPFTKPKLSSPISRIYGNSIQVYTDNFVVATVYIDYIRKPIKLIEIGATFPNNYYDTDFNNYDYLDFPVEALSVIMDNMRDRLLELVESNRLNTAVQESQGFDKK
jgi:hypothetical protein